MQNDQKWPIWELKLQCSKTKATQCVIGLHRLYNYLKNVSFKNNMKKTCKVERLTGLSYIILAMFEVSFMGDFELIQMKPTLCKGRVSVAWKFKCLKLSLQFNLWTF